MLPVELCYNHASSSDQNKITKKVTDFYFNKTSYDGTQSENLTNLFTDVSMAVGLFETLKLRFKQNCNETKSNTFVYLFSHKGSASFSEVLSNGDKTFYGSSHMDELLYIFSVMETPKLRSDPTLEDRTLSKYMVKLWVDFATFG